MDDTANIQVTVNGEAHSADHTLEATSLLTYLRGALSLTGCKEGCSEGDCGACMVLVQDLEGGTLRCRSVNACITLLGAIDGKAVTTVEGLIDADGNLHPLQQTMVDQHASQCGFCTPGFVISEVALLTNNPTPSSDEICQGLAGNLCRCTGYRPILAATRLVAETACGAIPENPATYLWLQQTKSMRPGSLVELDSALAVNPDATLIAGGTDLVPQAIAQGIQPENLIWISNVDELLRTCTNDTHTEIGAGTTLAHASALLLVEYPELAELVRRVASPSITRVGTLGGNLVNASPVGDFIPVLIALGAELKLHYQGTHRWLAIEDFYTGYRATGLRRGEVLETVRVPVRSVNQRVGFYKVAKRFEQDTASVLGAFSVRIEEKRVTEARLSFGGLAAVHGRAANSERALLEGDWTAAGIDHAMRAVPVDFQPISDLRATREYRLGVAANLLRKWYLEHTSHEAVSLWKMDAAS